MTTARKRQRVIAAIGAILGLLGAVLTFAPQAGSVEPPGTVVISEQITLCHATNAINNAYGAIPITVSVNGADGELQGNHGQHLGPVLNPTMVQGDVWGDIIPPFRWGPGPDDVFPGLNWDANGQAIYDNDCVVPPLNLTIVKQVSGAVPDTWSFGFGGTFGAFSLTDGAPSTTFEDIDDGPHTVSETGLEGEAQFASVSCDDGDWSTNGAEVTVSFPNFGVDNITCTFVNRFPEPGTITVVKEVTGAPPANWEFGFESDFGDFSLNDSDNDEASGDLSAGSYTIAEGDPGDAVLTSIDCGGADAAVTVPSVTVNLTEGEDVVCTFTNHFPVPGSITVVKTTTGAVPADWSFDFESDELGDFSLTDDDSSEIFGDLDAGVYGVNELAHLDAQFVSVDCGEDDVTVTGAEVEINLAEGDDVVCTYTNHFAPASVTIVKEVTGAAPDEWEFEFISDDLDLEPIVLSDSDSSATYGDLVAGDYAIEESQPADAEAILTGIDCGDADASVSGSSVAINVNFGDDVTCTFTNHFPVPGSITIVKQTTGDVPDDWSFGFESPELGDFALTTDSSSTTFDALPEGSYHVAELAHADADFVSADCGAADAVVEGAGVDIELPEDGAVVCTFTNAFPEVLATAEPRPIVQPQQLPRTGDTSPVVAALGLTLIGVGALLLAGNRRLTTIGGIHLR